MKQIYLSIILALAFSQQTKSQAYPPDSIALRQIYEIWYNAQPCYNNITLPVSQWCHVYLDSTGRVSIFGNQTLNQIAPNSYLPPVIGQLSKLKSLYLNLQNNLTGTLPIEIGDLSELEILNIQATNMTGSLPGSLNNLKNIKQMVFNCRTSSQRFNGILPILDSLNKLNTFLLEGTDIRGNIPGYFGYLDSIGTIDIVSNPLFGDELSDSLCHSQSIGQIRIGDCPLFHGKLPECLGYIPTLSELYLYKTNFSDTIPYSVCNPDTNMVAYLSSNQFTGMATMQPGTKAIFYDLRFNKIQFGCFEDNLASLGSANQFNVHIGDLYPQDSMWSPVDTTISTGSNITFDSRVTGQYNMYYWYKDSVYLGWNTTGIWELNNVSPSDAGQYNCRIRNYYITPLKNLVLDRYHIRLNVDTTVYINNHSVFSAPEVYPVPFDNGLNIKLNNLKNKNTIINLYNTQGVVVFTCETGKNYQNINTTELTPGLYFLKLQQGEKLHIFKLIKEIK